MYVTSSPVKVFYAIYSLQFTMTQYCITGIDDIYSVVPNHSSFISIKHLHTIPKYRWGMKISRFSTNKSLYLADDTRYRHSYYGRRIGNRIQT